MIHYDLFENDSFIIVKYPKSFDEDLIISFMKFMFYNLEHEKIKKILIDFRDCKPNFEIDSLNDIKNARLEFYDGIQTVYLVNSSIETAYTLYFAKNFKNINICSTIEYAIKLLNINTSKDELEDTISKLTKKYTKA